MGNESYLQIHVPLDYNSPWFQHLRAALAKVTREWHKSFHITIAFIKDELDINNARKVAGLLSGTLDGVGPLSITFDKLDAFPNQRGTQHIVNLTASCDQPALTDIVNKVRTKLIEHGFNLGPYRLHVTLSSINVTDIDLKSLQEIIDTVKMQPFTLTLYRADYRFLGETNTIKKWHWKPSSQPASKYTT